MKTIIFGKNIEEIYEVVPNYTEVKQGDGTFKKVFQEKPVLKKKFNEISPIPIVTYDGEFEKNMEPNSGLFTYPFSNNIGKINISETEAVNLEKVIFRADIQERHVFTDKVMNKEEFGREDAEQHYAYLMSEFNSQMIESNDRLKAYCNVNKLNPEETDVTELWKVVFGDVPYMINDGKITEKICKVYITSGSTTLALKHED